MTANKKWRRLIAFVFLAEVFTLSFRFGLPALQGRAFLDPHFPLVIVFHQSPPGCIVDFQGNVFTAAAATTLFWMCAVLVVAGLVRSMRRRGTKNTES
jgi:hypothetical protein